VAGQFRAVFVIGAVARSHEDVRFPLFEVEVEFLLRRHFSAHDFLKDAFNRRLLHFARTGLMRQRGDLLSPYLAFRYRMPVESPVRLWRKHYHKLI